MAESLQGRRLVVRHQNYAFTPEHQEILGPIAALLGSAVEHWRMWDAERRRRERLDQLERCSATLAESLDVREVFERLRRRAAGPRAQLHGPDRARRARPHIRVAAHAGDREIPGPIEPSRLTDEELERGSADFEIIHDIPAELAPAPSASA